MKRTRNRPTGTPRPVKDYAVAPPPSLTLAEVLEEAVIWQPEAEEVIALCVATGGKTARLARRTALVATAYSELLEAARTLPPSPQQREAVRLLSFHHRLVHEALHLGFRPDSPFRERVAAHFRGGLAGPGRLLAALYKEVSPRPSGLRPVAEDPDPTLGLGWLRDTDDP